MKWNGIIPLYLKWVNYVTAHEYVHTKIKALVKKQFLWNVFYVFLRKLESEAINKIKETA
jgi:hypothetical protein